MIVIDALRIGLLASILAFLLAAIGLSIVGRLGYLTVFGIRLVPSFDPVVVLATLVGALIVTGLSAALATASLLQAPPWTLLTTSIAGLREDLSDYGLGRGSK